MESNTIARNLGDSFSSRINIIGKTEYLIKISVANSYVGNKKRM